jgi:hypothetical protein
MPEATPIEVPEPWKRFGSEIISSQKEGSSGINSKSIEKSYGSKK